MNFSLILSISLIILFFIKDCFKNTFTIALFKPFTILNIYLLVFFIIPLYLGSFFFNDYLKTIDFTRHFTKIAWIITCLIIFLRFIDRRSFKEIIIKKRNLKPKLKFSLSLSVMIFIILIFSIMFPPLFKALVDGDLTRFSMSLRDGSALKFFLFATLEAIPLLVLIYSNRINKFFIILVILISFIAIILLGARALILTLFLSLILYFINIKKVKFKTLFSAGLFLIIIFSITSLNRSGGKDFTGYLLRNLDQLTNTAVVMEKLSTDEINYQYGATLIDAIYFFIPTALWPEKPRSYFPSRLVYPQMIEDGVRSGDKFTMNFGLIGRSYLEGGIIGVFFISTIVLILFNKIYNHIVLDNFKSLKNKFIAIYIFSHIHQILIIGPTSHVYGIYIISIFILLSIIALANTIYRIRNNNL